MQADLAAARHGRDAVAAAHLTEKVGARAERAALEANVAAAVALRSPQEWRRWMMAYVRVLTNNGDEVRSSRGGGRRFAGVRRAARTTFGALCSRVVSRAAQARLREVVLDLLGPVRWTPEAYDAGNKGAKAWSPDVCGVDKRALLR